MAKAMAQVKVVRRWAPHPVSAGRAPSRRPARGAPVRLVAVAASTGGPAALQRMLAALPGDFATPILVVQHIAKGFITGLAEWLSASCNLVVKVAEPGDLLTRRTVFLAPDDRHLGVGHDGRIVLADAPAVFGFRPSGSYLFASAAQVYGPSVVAVILTGMGSDGVEGLKAVKAAGGYVLAQDQASSVVYGMPAEAVAAGVTDAVLPIDDMATRLVDLVAGESNGDSNPGR